MSHALIGLAVAVLAAADVTPRPPVLRLPDGVRPVRQAVELTVDPNQEAFSGSVEIELEVRESTSLLWLNAAGLKVTSASVGRSGAMHPARVVAGGDDFVGFSTDSPLGPGPARLHASFEGAVSRRDNEGIFAVQEAGAWYVFTQFEAIAARRAFPCFDEPSYKIPWQVTLRVPHDMIALSNSPAVSTTEDGERDVVRYAPTPPLPSYLVAFAAGPFDLVDVGPSGRNRTPTRLAVPRGRGPDTAWSRESTPQILGLLEDYFDRPYPYAKLDQVAIPGVGFAMEHPGLVTYGMGSMVQRPAEETIASRRGWASVCAHELAHQWFGDLVTMAWWDDTWLNESFASWLGEKVTDRFRPDWGVAVERAANRSSALEADSLATARRIRQPITSKDDIYNAFDGVTYGKGQAVLEMLEAWLGEDVFRRGVQGYIERHAEGSATAADFVGALSAAAGQPVGPVLETFLDQTGAPVISAEARCDGVPRLLLSQRPFRPLGSPAEPKAWKLPVCARLSGRTAPACTLLSAETGEIPLEGGACPEWYFANAGAAGYFRALQSAAAARRVLDAAQLGAAERVALAGDLAALVASGDIAAGEALGLVPLLARDPDRHVVAASIGLVDQLEPLVPDALVPRFRRVVRDAYGPTARSLGWSARPGDSEEVRLLRRSVVRVTVRLGRDADLEREAAALAARWLENPSALDPDLVGTALAGACGAADSTLFERLMNEARHTSDREQRERVLQGLGAVRDPDRVRQVLALTLDERLDPRETVWLLFELGSQRETRRTAFDFLTANYETLVARLPRGEMSPVPYLPWVGAGLCEADTRQEIGGFFEKRSASVTGAPRVLAQILESVDQCVALKRAQQKGLAAYLVSLKGR
jgi:alanyl aminopeptidase